VLLRSLSITALGLGIAIGVAGCGDDSSPGAATAGGGAGGNAGNAAASGSGGTAGASGASGASSTMTAGAPSMAGSGSGGGAGQAAGGSAGAAGAPVVDTSPELYDPDKLPRFDLELPPASVQALGQAPDVYVHGTLRYGTESVSDIGVRIKGEASQRTLDEKAAFKLKFDEFVDKQSFRGLRRMTFNNMVEDPSYLAERLAYHFFRELGLPAPRCNHALIYVNGTFFGLYVNIETEDKAFLRRWFKSDAGNLYEEGQVDFEPGNESMFDLETNEEKNDRSDLTALIAAIASAQPASFLADVGAHLDMDHFLAFTAAEAAVNQWDMYGYTVFYPNNFRIYRNPDEQRFVMLPWGMDMSMKPYRDSGKPHIMPLELARQYDQDNGPVTAGLMFRKCLESAACKDAYVKVVGETATRYEQAGLEAIAKKYYAQIEAQIAADPRREYSAPQIETGYQSLLKTIRERPKALRDALEQ
jgi:hypothetical protein